MPLMNEANSVHETEVRQLATAVEQVEITELDNAVLRRLVEDVRNESDPISSTKHYNRQHNRHNR